MDIYEIQREIQAPGVVGLQNMQVCINCEGVIATVTKAELKYDDSGNPFVLLSSE